MIAGDGLPARRDTPGGGPGKQGSSLGPLAGGERRYCSDGFNEDQLPGLRVAEDLTDPVHAGTGLALPVGRALDGAALVLDGCDNFATRLAVSDACVQLGIPLTSAAVARFQGQVANFAGHLPDQPCYRCWVGDAFDAEDCDTCAADGVLGAFVGMVGTMAAMAAIRVLVEGKAALGDPQWGKLHLLDGLAPSIRTITVPHDATCRGCGAL